MSKDLELETYLSISPQKLGIYLFDINNQKNLYFYPSKRWDLKLKSNIVLKLSKNPTREYLNDLYEFLEQDNLEKFNIVDARFKNQIILNE